jgi:hypothetical protein
MSVIVDFLFDLTFHSEVSGMCPRFVADELVVDRHALVSILIH